MEEYVGQIWHRFITQAASKSYPESEVALQEMQKSIGILFRGMGGDNGLDIRAASQDKHKARRSLVQKIAGTGQYHAHTWVDHQALRLPATLSCFPSPDLNKKLYIWLSAMASQPQDDALDWIQKNAQASRQILRQWPGLKSSYQELVAAHLEQRPDMSRMQGAEAKNEQTIRDVLLQPENSGQFISAAKTPIPVLLWLHPNPPELQNKATLQQEPGVPNPVEQSKKLKSSQRHKGERVDSPDEKGGLLAFRLESLFTRAEFAGVDRSTEDGEDEEVQDALDDMDTVSVSADTKSARNTVKFDLDLPSVDHDDLVLDQGILLPEWDYKKQKLRQDYCQILVMEARDAVPCQLPAHLRHQSRKIRQQFEAITPTRVWKNRQYDGSELDIDAWIQHSADMLRGQVHTELPVYRQFSHERRDLSCLLLADLSLSTDTSVNDEKKVIDVIRESLFLFAEAMSVSQDPFAIYGFSSRRRDHVRLSAIKTFDQGYDDAMRGRINAIKPGYYTRMGAAIRYASTLLEARSSQQKLLLILTDGKPNDLDVYEGRYGIEDTRQAIQSCLESGVRPFCVSIDDSGHAYLPYLFGSRGYIHLRKSQELPKKLPLLYTQLTQA
ncbi:MAG: VWA domain-containing protein [bacterium]